jgi:hypothetical protein
LLPSASDHPEALIRVFAARTVRWRHLCGTHLDRLKECGASRYTRYDYTAWGNPIPADGLPRTPVGLALYLKPLSQSMVTKPAG